LTVSKQECSYEGKSKSISNTVIKNKTMQKTQVHHFST